MALDLDGPPEAVVADQKSKRVRRRAIAWAIEHPVLATGVVALAARVLVAVGSFVLNSKYFVGDELQYIQLAEMVAGGRSAEEWFPGYGQSLYDATHVFIAPITFLFKLFGPSRLTAQLYVVAGGVATAVLVARLALEAASKRRALVIGLTAALFPSQVLWSSIVLREALIWAALVALALGVAIALRSKGRALAGSVIMIVAALFLLGELRQQTMVVAAWALIPAALVGASRNRSRLAAGAVAIAIVVPWFAGFGWFGWNLVERAIPSLARTRANQSYAAESAFGATTIVTTPTPTTTAPIFREGIGIRPRIVDESGAEGGGLPPRPVPPPVTTTSPPPTTTTLPEGLEALVVDGSGNVVAIEESLDGSLSALPKGLIATLFRPLPWEGTTSADSLFARVENLAWYALYLAAVLGVWRGRRRHRRVIAYPFFVSGLVIAVAAVTQGNLGTAFRHRGQIFWALALIAGIGIHDRADQRRARAASTA